MGSPTNKARQFRNINEYDIGKTVQALPQLDKTTHDRNMVLDQDAAIQIDELPTVELPSTIIDQLSTLTGLPVITPWSFPALNDIAVYDQATWLIPVVRGPGKTAAQVQPAATRKEGGESYISVIRNLVKNSGIYALSSLASPLITLLLSPFLAHVLSRTDYGALTVLTTAVTLATGISELGLGAAFTRMYNYDCKTRREQLDVLSTLVLFLLLILIPGAAIGAIAAPWLSDLVLGSASYNSAVRVGALLVLSQNLTVPGLMWLRAESRATLFSIISIANLLMTAGANIVLVGMLHMSIVGSLTANGLGDIIIIICTLPIIFWRAGFHLRFPMVGSMLSFGVPHVTNIISGWVLQLSDRYLLGHFASLSLAAGYSVAYTLGGVASTAIIGPFSLAWWVLLYTIAKRKDAKYVYKLVFRGFSFVLLSATMGLSLFASSVLALLFPPSYMAEASIIPVIALSVMFYGIFTVVNLGISLRRKTWLTSLYFIGSALMNVGLNIVLIPIYGTMGAALATLVAYLALTLVGYIVNQLIYPVPFEVGLFIIALAIGSGLYLADHRLVQNQSVVLILGVHTGTLLLYGACLLLLGWFLPNIKNISFPYVKSFIKHE